jgi:hypothetical protein
MRKAERLTLLGRQIYDHLVSGHYVKGYGNQVRVMSPDHSPVFNTPVIDFDFVKPYCQFNDMKWTLKHKLSKQILDAPSRP